MGYYVYASCVGNVYLTDEPEDFGPCEMCGDYDEYIGYGDTKEEIAELLYRDNYTVGAIYDVTGMVPDLWYSDLSLDDWYEHLEEMRDCSFHLTELLDDNGMRLAGLLSKSEDNS